MKQTCLGLLILAGCAAPTPETQRAEYTVKTAAPTIGTLTFTTDALGHVQGSLNLDAALDTTHPLRVAQVWQAGQFGFFDRYWQSLLVQEGQETVVVDASAGPHPFSLGLGEPPAAAIDASPSAVLVAFIDVNENGLLDLSTGPSIDHVLASSDFPQLLLGHLGSADAMPVFDDPALDVVACAREDRFAIERACGVVVSAMPRVSFVGEREGETVRVSIEAAENDRITVDGKEWTPELPQTEFAVGQHQLRVVGPNGGVFESSFTFPDGAEVTAIRGAGLNARGAPEFDVDFKPLTGASSYRIIASRTDTGFSPTPTVRLVLRDQTFFATVDFGHGLPFRVSALHAD